MGKPAPLWMQKLLSSWMVIAALTKTYMLSVGVDEATANIIDNTFIYSGGLIAIFFPISGIEDENI